MKKVLSVVLSLAAIVIVIYGLSESLSFSDWMSYDILIGIALLINVFLFASIKKASKIININTVLLGIMVFSFLLHFTYPFWIVVDVVIILGSIYSIGSIIKTKL